MHFIIFKRYKKQQQHRIAINASAVAVAKWFHLTLTRLITMPKCEKKRKEKRDTLLFSFRNAAQCIIYDFHLIGLIYWY